MSEKLDPKYVSDKTFKNELGRLDDQLKRLTMIVVEHGSKIEKIERDVATKSDVQRILGAIDAFAQKAEAYDRKTFSHADILQDHEAKLRDHGRRITAIESKS